MPAGKSAGSLPVDIGPQDNLRVDCYVRSTVPMAITATIDTVVERLHRLCVHGYITDYQLTQWPPERHAVDKTETKQELTRHGLVSKFERWATQHGHSLEPAFCREEIPSSPLGLGAGEPRERVQVPLIALALSTDEDDTNTNRDPETLHGIVPYTDQRYIDDERTYTVNEWLSAVEIHENLTHTPQTEQRLHLEEQ